MNVLIYPTASMFIFACYLPPRSEDAALVHLHNRISPYPHHHQQSQPVPHHHNPMSPVSHSKSTEFPRSNGYFDGPPSIPMAGTPIQPASSSGMMSSNLSRSISSGYVWKDEQQPLALDQDPHHNHCKSCHNNYCISDGKSLNCKI